MAPTCSQQGVWIILPSHDCSVFWRCELHKPSVVSADIPKTQQLTSQQYKWINNTTGEGFVFLFWAWTVRFTSSLSWKHQESSIRFYVTKSRFMITVHVNNIHCLISVTLMIIYLWGHCTLISAVQVEFVIIMIRSDRLDEFTLL